MRVLDFLAMLRERDVQVWAEGDRLRCSAPTGALTPALQEELRQRKPEILRFLDSARALAEQPRAVVPLQARGTSPPVFAVAGHNGDVFCYRALARYLGENQPFFGLQPPGLDGRSEPLDRIEDLANYFAEQIRAFRPRSPYVIAGYCAGGSIALELACQLLRDHAEIHQLALFGSPFPTWYRLLPQLRFYIAGWLRRTMKHARRLAFLSATDSLAYVAQRLRGRRADREAERRQASDPVVVQRVRLERATLAALRRYAPGYFAGRLSLFVPNAAWLKSGIALAPWLRSARESRSYGGPDECSGDTMLREPHAAVFAELFRRSLRGLPSPEVGPLLAHGA